MSVKIELFEDETLEAFKPVNGGCLAPPLYGEAIGRGIRKEFTELYLPITRLHDAPLENPALNLVDIPMIFPMPHLDPDDIRNYNFKATDDYLKNCLDCGTQIYFRLGVSIEQDINKYYINPPEDTQKWIEIASHIIRHYNEGWGNGFHFDIKYWEIWNEAEGVEYSEQEGPLYTNWKAPYDTFLKFYVETATELKRRFPDLKIGGPSTCGWVVRKDIQGNDHNFPEEFLRYCAEHHAPLDFFSTHLYTSRPYELDMIVSPIRKHLDDFGYTKTELHLSEWSYSMRRDLDPQKRDEVRNSTAIAAFNVASLVTMQDSPIDMAHHYTVTATAYGLLDMITHKPKKSYYGMKAYNIMTRFFPQRFKVSYNQPEEPPLPPIDTKQVTALRTGYLCNGEPVTPVLEKAIRAEHSFKAIGGKDEKGNLCVVVGNFRQGSQKVTFHLAEPQKYAHVEAYLVDDANNLDLVSVIEKPTADFTLSTASTSAVWLVKFFI